MTSSVAQLLEGVRIRLKDGTEFVHPPFTVAQVRQLLPVWRAAVQRVRKPEEPASAGGVTPQEKADAYAQFINLLSDLAPDLANRLTPGDAVALMPDFFWHEAGAVVVAPPAEEPKAETAPPPAPTGMPSGASTSPPSA